MITPEENYKVFFDLYKPISLEEFLSSIGEEQPNHFSSQHSKLESTVSRISRIVSKDAIDRGVLKEYPFFKKQGVRGLSDVLNDLVNEVNTSAAIYKTNKAGIILLCGPTGSGKTVIGEALERGLMSDFLENPCYAFRFKTENESINCSFDESPINLFTSLKTLAPDYIREKYARYSKGELCFSCVENYRKVTDEIATHPEDTFPPKGEEQTFEKLLSKGVEIMRIGPKSSIVDLSDRTLPLNLTKIIKNANRGILHINIDNLEWENIPPTNYKFLLSLRDNVIPINDGTYFKPDMFTIIYGNEDVLEMFKKESPQLVDRLLPVYVRRNLSHSEESKIIKKGIDLAGGVGYSCIPKVVFNLLAKFCVGTRIDLDGRDGNIEELLEAYDRYENYKKLKKEEYEMIMDRLNFSSENPPIDGWVKGVSNSSFINSFMDYASNSNKSTKKCFTLEDVIKLMNKMDYQYDEFDYDEKELYEDGDYRETRTHIRHLIYDIVRRDVNYAYLAIINGGSISEIENLFNEFYSDQKLRDTTRAVKVEGDKMSIESHLEELSSKLGIDKGKRKDFELDINDLLDEYNEKSFSREDANEGGLPFTFLDIILKDSQLISNKGSLEEYVTWENILTDGAISKNDEERVKKLKMHLADSSDKGGYCFNCANSVLKLFARDLK